MKNLKRCDTCDAKSDNLWTCNSKALICSKCMIHNVYYGFGWQHWPYIKRKLLGKLRRTLRQWKR